MKLATMPRSQLRSNKYFTKFTMLLIISIMLLNTLICSKISPSQIDYYSILSLKRIPFLVTSLGRSQRDSITKLFPKILTVLYAVFPAGIKSKEILSKYTVFPQIPSLIFIYKSGLVS